MRGLKPPQKRPRNATSFAAQVRVYAPTDPDAVTGSGTAGKLAAWTDTHTLGDSAASYVSGSGATNRLAFWSSASVLGSNANFNFNGSGLVIGDPGAANSGTVLALGTATGNVKLAIRGGSGGTSTNYGFGYTSGKLISYIYGPTDRFVWRQGNFGGSTEDPMSLVGDGRLLVNTTTDDGVSIVQANGRVTAKAGGFYSQPAGPPTVSTTYQTGLPNPLPTGTYYYRVSAVTPFGESLPSTEKSVVISVAGGGNPIVSWSSVDTATAYRVYGRTSGGEQLLGETAGNSFTDDSTLTPSGAMSTVDRSSGVHFPDDTYQGTAAPTITRGTATLVAGTATVNTSAITASSKALLTHEGTGTAANFGVLSKGTVTAGTSFVINSSNAADDDSVAWWLVD